jgi:hypothetical protein
VTGANGITAYGQERITIEASGMGKSGKRERALMAILPWRISHRQLYFHARYAVDKMKSMGKMGRMRRSPWTIWILAMPGQQRFSSGSTHNGRRTGGHTSTQELP